ncbi:hypothetical protein PMAYCL1PPCAC_03555 [Pristionchus mayeri]|uniref:Uncharacterized protein n=1 Tax=Pristionchus mayeri TaxID=1317129 RepID=A0AAN4ZAB9_9BILA|nr:hypothetical protein PMAYCL1PPCAC_03555 [Pristionchus mayeri]
MTSGCCTCCLLFLALWCPPLAVGFHMGCGCDMCINLLLTILFYFPGLIHAWVVILTKNRDDRPSTVVHVHPAAPPSTSVVVVNNTTPAPVTYPPYVVQPPYAQGTAVPMSPEALAVKGCPPPQYQ